MANRWVQLKCGTVKAPACLGLLGELARRSRDERQGDTRPVRAVAAPSCRRVRGRPASARGFGRKWRASSSLYAGSQTPRMLDGLRVFFAAAQDSTQSLAFQGSECLKEEFLCKSSARSSLRNLRILLHLRFTRQLARHDSQGII